jgi:hypothetical protein
MSMKRKARKRPNNCRPPFQISEAGHLLSTQGTSKAGRTLSKEGKAAKRSRMSKGCLHGAAETFQLTSKQKKNLPKALQKAILSHHRRLGKRIID